MKITVILVLISTFLFVSITADSFSQINEDNQEYHSIGKRAANPEAQIRPDIWVVVVKKPHVRPPRPPEVPIHFRLRRDTDNVEQLQERSLFKREADPQIWEPYRRIDLLPKPNLPKLDLWEFRRIPRDVEIPEMEDENQRVRRSTPIRRTLPYRPILSPTLPKHPMGHSYRVSRSTPTRKTLSYRPVLSPTRPKLPRGHYY